MRLIYAFLAVRMLRLARFDLFRHELLMADADAALARSRDRVQIAEALWPRGRTCRRWRPGGKVSTPAATAEGHICGRAWMASETVEDTPAS
ncbi:MULTISPECIES: hypothetical protein [Methylobacterium]|uniref:hypothetical protein n=1 Tax=Methylobacterium TaxID=407 RepID=UPI002F3558DE